jgi:hypothetical protein
MAAPPALTLDPAIRTWVLLPIFVAMFLISVLRHFAAKLMRTDTKVDLKALREAQAVQRSQRLRFGANFLHPGALAARRTYFCAKEARARGRARGAERRGRARAQLPPHTRPRKPCAFRALRDLRAAPFALPPPFPRTHPPAAGRVPPEG